MEAVLNELLNNALSSQIAADPATGAERLVAAHSREIQRVPYYQLAAQAQRSLDEQQQQSSQALQQQADEAAAASKAFVAAMQERHDAEVGLFLQNSNLSVSKSIQQVEQLLQARPLLLQCKSVMKPRWAFFYKTAS